ncbi:MAG: GIY-YIG nuclease family protein [Oscillospiraceae bacterium]
MQKMALTQEKQQHILKLREKANSLPLKSGVYIMKNKQNEIIYVGKAKVLKNRVVSYFRAIESHTPKVYKMVTSVWDFDTIITGSEFEALVLECSLIRCKGVHLYPYFRWKISKN